MSLEEQIAQTVDSALFTRLCNAVFAAEFGSQYQAIDGTRGDDGNDGWLESEQKIFAFYCPTKPERRTDADYRKKAFADLKKAAELRDSGRFRVERWTFVTPRKLSNSVIIAIRQRATEFGLQASQIEAAHLSALLLRHPELIKEFPEYQVPQIEDLINEVLQHLPSPTESVPEASEGDPYRLLLTEPTSIVEDADLKEVISLRKSPDREGAIRGLRGAAYRSTNPAVQLNAVFGLLERFSPLDDDASDLANIAESARNAARRARSKSAEAYLLAQKGYLLSFEFGRLAIDRHVALKTEAALGVALESPEAAAARQAQLARLSKEYVDAFETAISLAQVSQSASALASVLVSMGNAAGQRALTLSQLGAPSAALHERDVCKRSLLAAKDMYASAHDEHGVAHAQMSLANQLRFFGEVEEAMELVQAVIPVAEKVGDDDLKRKAGWLEDTLRTGKIPDYVAGERRQ